MLKRWYERHILPGLLDRAMSEPRLNEYRRVCASRASGVVLEIGLGAGRNLPFYPASVEHLHAVEPSMKAREMAAERIADCGFPVEFVELESTRFDLVDASVDTAVSTFTLCTVADVAVTLCEIRRVLKVGGSFSFVEHGLAPGRVAWWQRAITPFHRHVAGGCHLNRDIRRLIEQSGFELAELETGFMPGPRPWCFLYKGTAVTSC